MIVLEADGFLRVIHYPAREKDGAVKQFIAEVNDQAHVGTGRFGPGNFVDTFADANDVSLLIFHPTIRDDTAVNTIIQGGAVFNVNFVVPAIIVGINQMFADKTAQVMFVECAHNLFSSVC